MSARTLLVRPATGAAALVAAVLAIVVALVQPAQAHTGLVSSDPGADSTLAEEPGEVSLTFSEEVQGSAFVVAKAPDGSRVDTGAQSVDDKTIRKQLTSAGFAGTYLVSYRVVGPDGHPVEGSIEYDVTNGRTAPEAQSPVVAESFAQRHRGPLVAGSVGVLAVLTLALWSRKRADD